MNVIKVFLVQDIISLFPSLVLRCCRAAMSTLHPGPAERGEPGT